LITLLAMHKQFAEFFELLEKSAMKNGLAEVPSPPQDDPDKTNPTNRIETIVRAWRGEKGTFMFDGQVEGKQPYLSVNYMGRGNPYKGSGRLELGEIQLEFKEGKGTLYGLNWYLLAEGLPRAASGKQG